VLPAAGTYHLEVQAGGFKPYHAQATATTDSPAIKVDVALTVEGTTQTVEVTADTLAAETTSTQLGEVLNTNKIESVPLTDAASQT